MLHLLKKEANRTTTENGAVTYATTQSDCLDLFSTIGALRGASDGEITRRFARAYAEDPSLAIKTLFFARDVRGGLGERRVFRVLLRYLAQNEPGVVLRNLKNIAEYGRYDDLLVLLGTGCEAPMARLVTRQLEQDLEALANGGSVSLLAKWLPSVNASDPATVAAAKRLARLMGLRDAEYRKLLSRLRAKLALLENNLRRRDYTFAYEHQPARAMFKYRKAFFRNDQQRYQAFLAQVQRGEAVLHTGTLYPYDVILPCLQGQLPSEEERAALNATWQALPDFAFGENALAVVDGSGSMYGGAQPLPAAVALSLGLYFAQRNTGVFHNHFITFSSRPQLVEIKGRDLCEQARCCMGYNEVANTNLEAVSDLILRTAVSNRLPQAQLPAALYIISDMEFDSCAQNAQISNFEAARLRFARQGYTLPKVVFWNVASRNQQQPVTLNEQGVALVSGCTPRLFEMVAQGELSPYRFMLTVLQAPRYAAVVA